MVVQYRFGIGLTGAKCWPSSGLAKARWWFEGGLTEAWWWLV